MRGLSLQSRGRAALALPGLVLALLVAAPTSARAGDAYDVRSGTAREYRPVLEAAPGEMSLVPWATLAGRLETVGSYPIDRDGTEYDTGPQANVLARVGLRFHTVRRLSPWVIFAEVEGDAVTGQLTDGPDVDGVEMPATDDVDSQLRKATVAVSYGGAFTLVGGLMTSHWGMGLLAHDGAHGWSPGSALFTDPRGGDVVWRAMAVAGPFGGAKVQAAVAFDKVERDDLLIGADDAVQLIGSVTVGKDEPHSAGLYVVARRQTAEDDAETEVMVFDATGRTRLPLGDDLALELDAEAAVIFGTTELGPTPDFPTHDVLQVGAVGRAHLAGGSWGALLDVAYASGDENLDDDEQNAFSADRNFHQGFILHRHVMAAMTGRAPVTASDPELVGVPAEDLERVPTRGKFTNLLTLFPRFYGRPVDGLEIYGGPLVAFTPEKLSDPFNTKLAGGEPRNALNGDPGRYLGTEVDLGIRYTGLIGGTELSVGAEAGVFLPGSALDDADGDPMDPVWGVRSLLRYRL
ncbi:MAG: hypothetical protein ACQEXJ_16860 [Myxococcota bacterium]